ncbi:unnamed protein product [Closterium sp. Yama58-4]|nr:unnamed protein product [Closterium sp. Yama58-4]
MDNRSEESSNAYTATTRESTIWSRSATVRAAFTSGYEGKALGGMGVDTAAPRVLTEAPVANLTPENEILQVCRTAGPATIAIAPDLNGQTWRGWGTSLAWFANYIGKLPPDQLNQILDLIFDPSSGMGLNLARYLIGGSYNLTNSPKFDTATWEACAIPGYRPLKDGPYDWTRDWRQRKVLDGAIARGVDEVDAIIYSPPWWMTISGDTAGNVKDETNLQPDAYGAYADYMADVVGRFRSHWNVTFSTMNPANEALEGWWVKGARQEGCNFKPEQLEKLVWAVAAALRKRNLRTGVAGFDSFVGATVRFRHKFTARVKSILKRINVHQYVPPPSNTSDARQYIEATYVSMARMAIGLGKEVWVSEVGPMWVGGNQIDVALFLARSAIQSINIMGASAWIYWQAINGASETNVNAIKWGIFTIPFNRLSDETAPPLDIVLTKKFYVLKQLAHGSPRDSMPLQIDSSNGCQHCVAAFYHPTKHFISIFVVNQQDSSYDLTFTFTAFGLFDSQSPCEMEMWRTSTSEDASLVSSQSFADMPSSFAVTAEGLSMTVNSASRKIRAASAANADGGETTEAAAPDVADDPATVAAQMALSVSEEALPEGDVDEARAAAAAALLESELLQKTPGIAAGNAAETAAGEMRKEGAEESSIGAASAASAAVAEPQSNVTVTKGTKKGITVKGKKVTVKGRAGGGEKAWSGSEGEGDSSGSGNDSGSGSDSGGEEVFHVVWSSRDSKIDYLGESTKGDMVLPDLPVDLENEGRRAFDLELQADQGPIEELAKAEADEAEMLLEQLGVPPQFPHGLASRGIFCSRTLNLRSITTIGYDMDYTLIHYNVNAWEGRAYDYAMENLRAKGYPTKGLRFDPDLVIRGLVMDKASGNLVKCDRFGFVKRAMHGTEMLSNKAISKLYGRELVDLRNEGRWEFLNTLFSVSEAVVYMQMVDRLDQGLLPAEVAPGDYKTLYKVVARALFRAHVEGQLKAEIINSPEKFVELDPELPLALLDQKLAGKRLLLITNSDYQYTHRMMTHAFDRFLPEEMTWRSLFDMVIVSARKPEFFSMAHPLYEIVTPDGLMRPCFKANPGGLYCGGSAQMVEKALGFAGDETLYVGDHIYTDVSQSKLHLRWRTCLVCRELEQEVAALIQGHDTRLRLIDLMAQKDRVGDCFNQLRLALQRRTQGQAAQTAAVGEMEDGELVRSMQRLLWIMARLDGEIAPLLETDGAAFNDRWGYLSRAGLWDKSHITRQIEKYADIYTSRVSNFLRYTPFMYFRAQGQSCAHDVSDTWPITSLQPFSSSEHDLQ